MKKEYAVILAIMFLLVGGTAMAEDVDVNGNLKATSITFGDSTTQTTAAQPVTGGCTGQAISYIHSGPVFDCLPIGSGTVTSVATGSGLSGGPITTTGTISIANSGVTNSMLSNSSVTISTTSPLSGGGSVALGGSLNLVLGTVPVTSGGTGAITAAGARSALGSAASGANSDITSLSGLTTPLSVGQGGTGSGSKNFVDLTTNQNHRRQ